jgi:hypothetical protein
MGMSVKILFLVLFTPGTLIADTSDTANERIPVTRADMEIHWRVDCSANWETLAEITSSSLKTGSCEVSPDLLRNLQLCEFIHQPPGSSTTSACPDFKTAGDLLGERDCQALRELMGNGACSPGSTKSSRQPR